MHSTDDVLTRVLSDRQDALLREERGLLMRLRTALARIDASRRPAGGARSVDRAARRAVSARRRRRIQRRQERVHQRARRPAADAGRRHADDGRHHRARARRAAPSRPCAQANQLVVKAPVGSAPRNPHRRHAGHQRHHPRARGDDGGVHPALRSGLLRHVGRSPVHRDRARASWSRSAAGARRSSWSSTRATFSRARRRLRKFDRSSPTTRARCSGSSPRSSSSARSWRFAPSAASRPSGPRAASRRSSTTSPTTLNASGRAQLKLLNPARRRDWPLPNGSATSLRDRQALLKDDFCDARAGRRVSWRSTSATWSAISSCGWPTSRTCCSRWSAAAISSSTTRCASAA